MDNPVEVAFSPEGECFFITTFFHHPEAGKRDAIVHAIYGGAYPKVHGVVEGLQRTGELMPSMVELGPAAGCSLARYDSKVFGEEYENNLFSAEFNLRRVRRHILTPMGSTYRSENHDFLVADNPDFHPTDVLEDADGSLLVIDTGGWYKICCPTSQLPKPDVLGGIYRIRRTGMTKVEDPRGHWLSWDGVTSGELAGRLDDGRSAVRQRAIRGLASMGGEAVPALIEVLRRSTSMVARRNAVWALTRIDGASARAAVRVALDDVEWGVRQAALHSIAMRRDVEALPRVLEFLRSENSFHRRKAAEGLGRMGRREAVPALLAAAEKVEEGLPADEGVLRIQEHALIYALIEIGDAEATRRGLESRQARTRRVALIALDQMDGGGLRAGEVAPLLSSTDSVLKTTALWVVGNHPEWGRALASHFAERLAGGVPSAEAGEWEEQLARFVGDVAVQSLMAAKLVDGSVSRETVLMILRAMARSGLREAPATWIESLSQLLEGRDEELARASIATVRGLSLGKADVAELNLQLRRLAADTSIPEDLRVNALAALGDGVGELDEGTFGLLLRRTDPGLPVGDRGAAAGVLAGARLDERQLMRLAEAMKAVGPMEMNRLLDAFSGVTNEAVGLAWVGALRESRARFGLRTDLFQQRLAQFPESVQEAGEELLVELNVNAEEQNERLARLLEELSGMGSDVRRGQAVFNSERTACATCHAIGYLGGKVGPDLTSIGQIRTERDLLEALMYPSASFVRSYEPVIVTMKDGEEHSGVLAMETAAEMVLNVGADARMRLAKAEVAEVRPGSVSVMPSGLDEQLSKQDLADLLAFLRNTRWGAQ
jgi:putative heme-binding domain-containing protein